MTESDEDADKAENPEKEASQKEADNEDEAKSEEGEKKLDRINFKGGVISKGWLTTIGGQLFMCWEPKFVLDEERGMKPKAWLAWKVKLKKNKLSLAIVDARKAGETAKEIEEFIKANYLDDKKFKDGDWMHLKKIDKSIYNEVAKALERMGIGVFE